MIGVCGNTPALWMRWEYLMGALSDGDDYEPYLVVETPQEVTAKRHALEEELGTGIAPWAYEVELYEDAGLEPPTE